MDKSTFITGGSGFLGYNWIKSQDNRNQYYLVNNNIISNISRERFVQIKDINNLFDFFLEKKIKFILHFAAITNLEECEMDMKKCMESNYILTKKLVDLSKRLNIKVIFISSDQVYDGNTSYNMENDDIHENNIYAKSKIYSEKYILKNLNNFLILRTNFFGLSKNDNSFLEFIYKNLNRGKKIDLWRNIYFNPINVATLTNIIIRLLNNECNGIYNICSDKKISKSDFGYLVAKKYNLNTSLINEVDYFDQNLFRPKDMTMSNSKIKKELDLKKLNIEDEIDILPNCI